MEREFQIHRTEEDYALAEFWKWALAFLIGVAMGCIGFIVDWGIESLNNFKYYHTVGVIATQGRPWLPDSPVFSREWKNDVISGGSENAQA